MYETGSGVISGVKGYEVPQAGSATKLGLEAHAAELRGSIEEVAKRLHSLEARLSPILIVQPPATTGPTGDGPTPSRSPLLNASFDAKYAVHGLMRHIESLLNRIEL